MTDGIISKRSATERMIIAKTLLETVLQDMPSAQPEIIRCGECKNHIDGRCIIANHHTSVMDNCGSVMGAERREDG